jgi:acyl carrier protein
MSNPELKLQIKRLMVENLMLQITAEEIADGLPMFGPGGLGLDSVDALQLVVALDKNYGLKISDAEAAKTILRNVDTIAAAIEQKAQAAK